MASSPTMPLDGIRVIDMTTTLAGPYGSQILGDFGADVIKIEAPNGEAIRNAGPQRSQGMAATFMCCNRNKRSAVLDLKTSAGKDALWKLLDTAQVFLHAIRPQKIAALGFDPASVMERRPDIVYAALHGYHEHGPYGGRPAPGGRHRRAETPRPAGRPADLRRRPRQKGPRRPTARRRI